ncbi:MAG TPA: DUF4349 domain-containing protein [Polyangiaceae bacterium]
MLDIEAHVRIEVENVQRSAMELRQLVSKADGQITNESVMVDAVASARAEFTLRIPVKDAFNLLRALETLGVVRSSQVQTRDIGKEYYDAAVRLRNLEVTRDRLEQILKQAQNVNDILRIEQELQRVRGEMEQLKGQMRYLRDRAALATVFVSLFKREVQAAPPEVVVTPEAKLFPGQRAGYLLDIRNGGGTGGFYGFGLALGLSRRADLYLEGFRRFTNPGPGLDVFMATIGGRFYSEYLGSGTRRWLNPYLGIRAGYSHFEGRNEVVAGGALGVEIFKTDTIRLDSGLQAHGLFGTKSGAHAVLLPELGIDVAF